MAGGNHQDVQRFLIQLAHFGSAVSRAMQSSTPHGEFTANNPLLVLSILDLEGTKRPGALQELTGLSSGGTSKLLDRLEEAGLIHRSYGEIDTDYRGVNVDITPAGRKLARNASRAVHDYLHEGRAMVKELVEVLEQIDANDP